MGMSHRLSRRFGHREVDPEQRERLIRSVFQRVAPRYDLMNDLMSMGIHRWWKHRFCREADALPGRVFVDLAAGTGDIAARLRRPGREMILIDPSAEMLGIARQRLGDGCRYLVGSAEAMPLPDASVDVLTISFGIRNATDMEAALREIARVLRPGGQFRCLEFSEPAAWLKPFYDAWSRWVIPRLGAAVAGHPDAYEYLVESIREFPDQATMARLIGDAGLTTADWSNLSFGIAAIHRATRTRDAAVDG
jgi:demethylmenaquinone methyltransferase/2-methoxy-6-polyprenyl-1,4-benzoquinol methylase